MANNGNNSNVVTETETSSRMLLIVAMLLTLYAGIYLSLVVPGGRVSSEFSGSKQRFVVSHYRYGNRFSAVLFWPLEQVDKTLRPAAWGLPFDDSMLSTGVKAADR